MHVFQNPRRVLIWFCRCLVVLRTSRFCSVLCSFFYCWLHVSCLIPFFGSFLGKGKPSHLHLTPFPFPLGYTIPTCLSFALASCSRLILLPFLPLPFPFYSSRLHRMMETEIDTPLEKKTPSLRRELQRALNPTQQRALLDKERNDETARMTAEFYATFTAGVFEGWKCRHVRIVSPVCLFISHARACARAHVCAHT
jgi:hypothetical protein